MRIVKKFITHADVGEAVVVGLTEPGDMVVAGGCFVTEAFDGTTPTMDMGFVKDNQGGTADPNALATALDVSALGNKAADELAAATNKVCTAADKITATFNVASGSPSKGKGFAWALIINEHPFNEVFA